MRKNSFGHASDSRSGAGRLRVVVTCVALGIAVLYFSDRSIASFFESNGNNSSFMAAAAETTAALVQKVWNSTVTFNGTAGYGIDQFAGFYEVTSLVAVPEPSTWISGALVVGVVGCSQRRRIGRLVRRSA
jgi:PEP-CTERM motif-containing protein